MRNLSVSELFKKYASASDAEVACYFAYSGYNLYHDDVQASIYVHDGVLYGSSITHHHFLAEGYQKMVCNLRKASQIKPDLRTEVLSLQKREDGKLVARTNKGRIVASKVIIGCTAPCLAGIKGVADLISKERMNATRECKAIPLFKCFMEFSRPWWKDHGLIHGKTTTDLDCRQIHYYDDQDLLIYNSDGEGKYMDFASKWGRAFADDKNAALRKMFEEVKQVHVAMGIPVDAIPEPEWAACVYAYWPAGSHKWHKGADVRRCIELIADGRSDGSDVYITGDAFSDMQGCVQGAINTSMVTYEKAFAFEKKLRHSNRRFTR